MTKLFEYEHEFSRTEAAGGEERLDLALRITEVNSSVPVSFIMSDVFLSYGGESRFCEAYLSDGQPAIAPPGSAYAHLFPKKSLLAIGATVFLRDIPPAWWNDENVVNTLVLLVERCCKVDQGAQTRENLTEAMSQLFELIDTGERLLRRNRHPVTVTFSDATAVQFLKYLVEFDAAVLSIGKVQVDGLTEMYTAVVLIDGKHEAELRQRLGYPPG